MISLLIMLAVADDRETAFRAMYRDVYASRLGRQRGYLGSSLSRSYPSGYQAEFGGTDHGLNFLMTLDFATEEDRLAWVASPEHELAWSAATELSSAQAYGGYDVLETRPAGLGASGEDGAP